MSWINLNIRVIFLFYVISLSETHKHEVGYNHHYSEKQISAMIDPLQQLEDLETETESNAGRRVNKSVFNVPMITAATGSHPQAQAQVAKCPAGMRRASQDGDCVQEVHVVSQDDKLLKGLLKRKYSSGTTRPTPTSRRTTGRNRNRHHQHHNKRRQTNSDKAAEVTESMEVIPGGQTGNSYAFESRPGVIGHSNLNQDPSIDELEETLDKERHDHGHQHAPSDILLPRPTHTHVSVMHGFLGLDDLDLTLSSSAYSMQMQLNFWGFDCYCCWCLNFLPILMLFLTK